MFLVQVDTPSEKMAPKWKLVKMKIHNIHIHWIKIFTPHFPLRKWDGSQQNLQNVMRVQRRLGGAKASSDRLTFFFALRGPHVIALDTWLSSEHPVKTVIGLIIIFAGRTYLKFLPCPSSNEKHAVKHYYFVQWERFLSCQYIYIFVNIELTWTAVYFNC